MGLCWRTLAGGVFVLAGLACAAETNFDRYGIILDRKPFGAEPAIVVPPPPVVPPDQSVVNQIRMSAVVRDNKDGTLRVGLIDVKSNRNYILGIGETMDGIEVISADYVKERARLRRGPEDYWVSMAGGSNRFERVVEPAPEARVIGAPVMATSTATVRVVDQKLSYAKRRQQREEARLRVELERLRALEAEKAKLAAAREPATGGVLPTAGGVIRAGRSRSGDTNVGMALSAAFGTTNKLDLSDEEIAQMLQEYQKELIRSGQTPLAIPLTPESDQELVNEGVLPPQD
jgi:hypothetical protein